MKRILIVGSIVLVVLVALGVAGYTIARAQTPAPNFPYGPGMMGGRQGGMMGGWRQGGTWSNGTYGPLHTYMINAMAEAFDTTPEELQAAHTAGKTMWDIAQEKGIDQEKFAQLMLEARTKALEAAVADGVITQAQADWMLQRMQQMGQNGGFGPCHGGNFGGSGRGPGGRWGVPPTGTGS